MSTRTTSWLAWSICTLSLVLAALGLLFLVLSLSHGAPVFDYWFLNAVIAVSFSTAGAMIAPRLPPRNPMGWIFCAIGLVGGIRLFVAEYAIATLLAEPGSLLSRWPGGEVIAWVSSWVWVPHFGPFIFLALLFPDGRLPTPHWRPFAWLAVAVVAIGTFAVALWPETAARFDNSNDPLGIEVAADTINPVETIMYALALIAATSLLVRLWRSKGIERQQVKWFAYAAAVLAISTTLAYVVSEALGISWMRWASSVVVMVSLVGLPVAVGIAVLRYRLYNIDFIINRTLVYGPLTAVLALIYFGSVVLLQILLQAFTEERSQLAVVASTLAIAALFNPLRRRIQSFVDRRFYRRKYDAAKTLEAFSSRLRDETNLDTLSEHLVGVIDDTMRPAHVSLWLRPSQEITSGKDVPPQEVKR